MEKVRALAENELVDLVERVLSGLADEVILGFGCQGMKRHDVVALAVAADDLLVASHLLKLVEVDPANGARIDCFCSDMICQTVRQGVNDGEIGSSLCVEEERKPWNSKPLILFNNDSGFLVELAKSLTENVVVVGLLVADRLGRSAGQFPLPGVVSAGDRSPLALRTLSKENRIPTDETDESSDVRLELGPLVELSCRYLFSQVSSPQRYVKGPSVQCHGKLTQGLICVHLLPYSITKKPTS